MKFKRYKHARKLISFYKMNYGVREPYQVLGRSYNDIEVQGDRNICCSGWHVLSSSSKGQDLHQGAIA